jgi:hypothetical protein
MEKTTRIIRLKANAPELSIAQGLTKIVVPTDGDRHKRVYHSSVATLPALREKATHGHHLHATHHAEEAAKHHVEEHGSK